MITKVVGDSGPGPPRPLPVFTRHSQSWAARLPLTSCQPQLCYWESVGGAKNSLDSWPLSRLRAGSEPKLTMSQDSPLHGAFPLCYFNSLVTVLNPRGSLTGGLGITGLTVNSSGVKGPGHCPEPPMLHTTLTELHRDLDPLRGLLVVVSSCPICGFLGIILLLEHLVMSAFVYFRNCK